MGKGPNKTSSATPVKGVAAKPVAISGGVLPVAAEQQSSAIDSGQSDEAAQNEQKYLHKKFKRIASTATAEAPDGTVGGAVTESVATCETTISEVQRARLISLAAADEEEEYRDLHNGFNPKSNATSFDSETVVVGRVSSVSHRTIAEQTHCRPVVLEVSDDQQRTSASADHESVPASVEEHPRHIHTDQVVVVVVATDHDDESNQDSVPVPSDCSAEPSSEGDNGASSALHQINNNNIGRNVCHYCNLNCTKPSVLEKHIRSHTNERPYPCVPCGFAFKTKSNLYKHCRSRAHQLRAQGAEVPLGQGLTGTDDDISAGSDQELSSSASGSDEVSGGRPIDRQG